MAMINMGDGEYHPPDLWSDGGGQGITDPQTRDPQPTTTPRDPSIPSNDTPWVPDGRGSYMPPPEQAPPGKHWDPGMANWVDNAPTNFAASGGGGDDLMSRINSALSNARSSDDPNYWYGKVSGDPNGAGSAWGYWLDRINRGDGAQLGLPRFQDGNPGQTTTYGGSNPFSDPATKSYIDLLNSRIQQLLKPQQNPDMDPLLSYMRQYFQQLQQPTYTDAQRATIATQQLDPMERQRQARKQQIIQQFASRGMSPSDGPTQAALLQVDRDYDAQRSTAQGGIATNEINLGRQNQAQAVDVGSAIASLQNGQFQQQEQRSNQAVSDAALIPQLAQQRLGQSIQLLNGSNVNPAQLFGSLQGFQQQGFNQNAQDSQFWQQLFQALAQNYGL